MYTGTMIDELIASVARAEDHVADDPEKAAPAPADDEHTYSYVLQFNQPKRRMA